jgi:hypothetical protein
VKSEGTLGTCIDGSVSSLDLLYSGPGLEYRLVFLALICDQGGHVMYDPREC